MKCRLVQILAVAMVLGHTVLAPGLKLKKIKSMFNSEKRGEPATSSVISVAEPAASDIESISTLRTEVDIATELLTAIEFTQFGNTKFKEAYEKVNKLFGIKQRVLEFTHKDQDRLLKKMDKEIDSFTEKLRNAMQNTNTYIRKNDMYRQEIVKEFNINTESLSDVKIERIRNICNKAGINFPNTGTHLSLIQIRQKVEQVNKALDTKIEYANNILHRMLKLSNYIDKNPIRIMKRDTRDTQSMRNVIGISIAVCAIVTLCIVLLIAVHNKHRANAEVRLLKWV